MTKLLPLYEFVPYKNMVVMSLVYKYIICPSLNNIKGLYC